MTETIFPKTKEPKMNEDNDRKRRRQAILTEKDWRVNKIEREKERKREIGLGREEEEDHKRRMECELIIMMTEMLMILMIIAIRNPYSEIFRQKGEKMTKLGSSSSTPMRSISHAHGFRLIRRRAKGGGNEIGLADDGKGERLTKAMEPICCG